MIKTNAVDITAGDIQIALFVTKAEDVCSRKFVNVKFWSDDICNMLSILPALYFQYFLSHRKNIDFQGFYRFSRVRKFAPTCTQARKFSQLPRKYFSPKKLRPYRIGQHFRFWLGGKIIFGLSEGLQRKGNLDVPTVSLKSGGEAGGGGGRGRWKHFPLKTQISVAPKPKVWERRKFSP